MSVKLDNILKTHLTKREYEIICLRYGLKNLPMLTQREVAKKLNISRSYISRLEKKAIYVLKDVRFLGSSDIKFSTESDSSQTIEAGFVARRIETYYKPDNLPYATTQGVGASSIFDGRNRNGLAYDEVSINEDSEQE